MVVLSSILFKGAVYAQTAACAVRINVKSEDGVLVKEMTATATSYETKKVYRAVSKNGMPFFSQLTKGGYEFSISKVGFKRSVGGIPVSCESKTEILEVLASKGDNDEIFDITRRLKTYVGSVDSETSLKTKDLKEIAKSQGILNFDAVYLEKPKYPGAPKYAKAAGVVIVEITVDEKGKVESVKAIKGNPLLYEAAEEAAKKAKFKPTLIDGKPVKISGKLIYNFVL